MLKKKITNKTKGIILVHMNGWACNLKKLQKFCNRKKIKIIEDCAHALGTTHHKKHVGNFGISGSFSFYPTKQITTGEGGMLVTNNKKFYNNLKKLKAFGIDKDIKERKKPGEYDVKLLGFNYRMTDFQACMGFGQIINYKNFLIKRRRVAKRYYKNFLKTKELKQLNYSNENSYFIYPIFVKKRDNLIRFLKKNKIGFSIHYPIIVPMMSYYKKKYKCKKNNYINSITYANTNISLPVYPSLKNKEIDHISNKIIKFLKNEK